MKICFVIDRLAWRSGGAERVLIETANFLASEGHQIDIVSHEIRRRRPFYDTVPGISLSNLCPPGRNLGIIKRIGRKLKQLAARNRFFSPPLDKMTWAARNRSFYKRLETYLNLTQPDVIIPFLPPALVAVGLAKLNYPARKLASLHNVPEQDFNNPARWDPNPYDRKLRKKVLYEYEKIGVLLPEFFDWFPEDLRSRLVEMPNAIVPVDPEVLKNAKRSKTIISVGRLADVKRHDLLVEAWAKIHQDFPDWTVKVFGVGPNQKKLEKLIKGHNLDKQFILAGHTSDISEEYLKSAFMAHPAKFEGFGLVIGEAMVHGLPVIGFEDCPGLNSLVHDGENGLLIPAKDDRAMHLADGLAKLINETELRQRLAEIAPASMARYKPETIMNNWKTFIEPFKEIK